MLYAVYMLRRLTHKRCPTVSISTFGPPVRLEVSEGCHFNSLRLCNIHTHVIAM